MRFSLALLCLSLLAVAEDEKAPSSITLDDKTFKEKVSFKHNIQTGYEFHQVHWWFKTTGFTSVHLHTYDDLGGSRPCICDVLCSLVRPL